jgi:hypothetical protein
MMLGGMQDFELRVPRLLDHAAREHSAREIVTRWADGSETRTNWAGVARDARKLAQALERLGLGKGDRVATLAMNHSRHLVAWYGAIGMGGLIHTINPRLFDDQLAFIANHAEDKVLFYDKAFAPIVERLRSEWTTIEHYFCFDGDSDHPYSFETLLAQEDGNYAWVEGDEREPCMLCYTSGTTRQSQGVVYSHRSSVIHAIAELQPAEFDLSTRSVAMPIVPMFHAVGWGLPFAGAAVGLKFVFSAVNEPKVPVRADEPREGHPFGRRAHRLVRHVPAYGFDRRRPRASQDRHHRRFGGAAGDDRAADEDGRPRQPCLGHDRDLADRDDGRASADWDELSFRPAGRPGQQAGQGPVRGRAARRRRRGQSPAARRRQLGPPPGPRPVGDPPIFPGRKRPLRR